MKDFIRILVGNYLLTNNDVKNEKKVSIYWLYGACHVVIQYDKGTSARKEGQLGECSFRYSCTGRFDECHIYS